MKLNLALKYLSIATFLLCLSNYASAQSQDTLHTIFGRVIDASKNIPLGNVHVINKGNFKGTVTNNNGFFKIEMTDTDTIIFSNLGYQYSFYTYNPALKDQIIILLKEKNYLIEEVNVVSYKLTSNDPKPMSLGKPMIPNTEDLSYPEAVVPTVANPVDLLYYMFGNRPKQMRQLQELQRQDAFKQKLLEGSNRKILMDITGLSKNELESFMFFCRYSETYISTLNDYEFLISLLNCYNEYVRVQSINSQMLNHNPTQSETIDERFK